MSVQAISPSVGVGGFITNYQNPMYYDGKKFTIAPTGAGFILYADSGVQMEVLRNCTLDGQGNLLVPAPGFQKTHAAGFTLSYLQPGNPGPQGKIDYTNARFSQVVPYTLIIQ